MEQSRTEDQEADPCNYVPLIFDKGTKATNSLEELDLYRQNMTLTSTSPYPEILLLSVTICLACYLARPCQNFPQFLPGSTSRSLDRGWLTA